MHLNYGNTEQGRAIDFGNLIHEMMSKVITINDVDKVVQQYLEQGIINMMHSKLIYTK